MTLPLTASYPPEIHGVTLTSFSYVLIFFTLFGLCTTVVILLRMIRNIVRLIRIRQQSRKQDHIDSLFDSSHVRKEAGDDAPKVALTDK